MKDQGWHSLLQRETFLLLISMLVVRSFAFSTTTTVITAAPCRWTELPRFELQSCHSKWRTTTNLQGYCLGRREQYHHHMVARTELLSTMERDPGQSNNDHDNNDPESTDSPQRPQRGSTQTKESSSSLSKWDSLHPRIKERLVTAGQERAIANKKKREPAQEKKRRVMMFVKQKQQEKKIEARIRRPVAFDDRTPLAALISGMELTGTVISLTNFGASVDVGSECDGLLHISQFSRSVFVKHPKQMLSPGDEVTVRVRSLNPKLKKLHLTMLPKEIIDQEAREDQDPTGRISLDEIQIDDELWGELKRVTDFGAYVEVGAIVDGFLHFMDHPASSWSDRAHPSTYMKKGDRVRVWVADIDLDRRRIKLTANRPKHLPGPRREINY